MSNLHQHLENLRAAEREASDAFDAAMFRSDEERHARRAMNALRAAAEALEFAMNQ